MVFMSLVSKMSLARIGMPSSGFVSPAARASSAALACAIASGATMITECRPSGPLS